MGRSKVLGVQERKWGFHPPSHKKDVPALETLKEEEERKDEGREGGDGSKPEHHPASRPSWHPKALPSVRNCHSAQTSGVEEMI